jgi:hypothetical protein
MTMVMIDGQRKEPLALLHQDVASTRGGLHLGSGSMLLIRLRPLIAANLVGDPLIFEA